ncbi:MAG: CHASE2 domain-containing protein [Propionivibrio sp.]
MLRAQRESVFVALLLLLLALGVGVSGGLARLDHLILDAGQRLARRVVPDDIVIVAIDEDSLDRLGRWPWPRSRHAALIEALCAARPAVIGLDIAFVETGNAAEDAALAQAVAACGRVVLPLVIETAGVGGQVLESPPFAALLAGAAGLGRVGVRLDEDGIARSVDLREGVGAPAWPLFAAELLRVAGSPVADDAAADHPAEAAADDGADNLAGNGYQLLVSGRRLIDFAGPPGSVPRISYARVLAGGEQIPAKFFAGKTIVIGATAVGLGDFLPTPVSAHAQPMSGAEVQANVWMSLRDGRLIRPLPGWLAVLLGALLALVPLLWLRRLMPLAGLLASVAWVAAVILASALLPGVFQLWFPPAAAVVGGLAAFPLWSWRRLEAARRHLDQELRQLAAILPPGETVASASGRLPRMDFEQRIASVQAAQGRVRDLEAQRMDALAFISHDLRTPLASAVQRLEDELPCDAAQLLPSLRRAQEMAQDFLHLARAETLDQRRMQELDLVALLQQAADELYALARQRGQSIERVLPDDPLWTRGDFEALERCAINLLQNAVNYAPTGSAIGIGAQELSDGLRFWVENAGAALAAEQIERLFTRFGRGEHGLQHATSTGLGLYYVKTVAEKHGGTAGVECADGRVKFWVTLPQAARSV